MNDNYSFYLYCMMILCCNDEAFNFFCTDIVLRNAFRLETDKSLNRMGYGRAHAICTFIVPHFKIDIGRYHKTMDE